MATRVKIDTLLLVATGAPPERRLVLDEPTDLPEGTEVELVPVDEDDLEPEERERFHAALERSMAQARAGQLIDADIVISKLLNGR